MLTFECNRSYLIFELLFWCFQLKEPVSIALFNASRQRLAVINPANQLIAKYMQFHGFKFLIGTEIGTIENLDALVVTYEVFPALGPALFSFARHHPNNLLFRLCGYTLVASSPAVLYVDGSTNYLPNLKADGAH